MPDTNVNSRALKSFFHELPKEVSPHTNTQISDDYFSFIGRHNIAMRAAASTEFETLLRDIFEIGQHNPKGKFEDNVVTGSRRTVTRGFCTAASIYKTLQLAKIKGYSALIIDAGTIAGNHRLNIVVANALLRDKPILYSSLRDFIGTTKDYIEAIAAVIPVLQDAGITITAIVGDNLAAQKNAFTRAHPNSIQQNEDNAIFRQIRFIPCLCHTMALAFNEFAKEDPFCSNFKGILETIAFLRETKTIRFIREVCPNYCITRWTSLFQVFRWLTFHEKSIINKLLDAPKDLYNRLEEVISSMTSTFTHSIPLFLSCITAYTTLIGTLEREETSMASSYVIIKEAQQQIQELANQCPGDEQKEIAQQLNEKIERRLQITADARFLRFLSSLTFYGRHYFRTVECPFQAPAEDIIDRKAVANHISFQLEEGDKNRIFEQFSDIKVEIEQLFQKLLEKVAQHPKHLDQIERLNFADTSGTEDDESLEFEVTDSGIEDIEVFKLMNELSDNEEDDLESIDDDMQVPKDYRNSYSPESIFEEHQDCCTDVDDEPQTEDADSSSNILEDAFAIIDEECDVAGIVEEEREKAKHCFMQWISKNYDEFGLRYSGNGSEVDFWTYVSTLDSWKTLATITLRFLVAPASEASAERFFSMQNLIFGKARHQTGQRLEEARLTFGIKALTEVALMQQGKIQ